MTRVGPLGTGLWCIYGLRAVGSRTGVRVTSVRLESKGLAVLAGLWHRAPLGTWPFVAVRVLRQFPGLPRAGDARSGEGGGAPVSPDPPGGRRPRRPHRGLSFFQVLDEASGRGRAAAPRDPRRPLPRSRTCVRSSAPPTQRPPSLRPLTPRCRRVPSCSPRCSLDCSEGPTG